MYSFYGTVLDKYTRYFISHVQYYKAVHFLFDWLIFIEIVKELANEMAYTNATINYTVLDWFIFIPLKRI